MTSIDLTFSLNHEFPVSNRFARWWIRIERFFWHLCYHDRCTNQIWVSGRGFVTSQIWPMTSSRWHGIINEHFTPKIFNRDASKHNILCRIERGTRWWRFHAATIDSFDAIDSWSWKIMEFAKIWPLTCHNWVKYWPRTKNNTTNREYSARAICWSFPRSSTTLRLETPRGGRTNPPPPPYTGEGGKTRFTGEG